MSEASLELVFNVAVQFQPNEYFNFKEFLRKSKPTPDETLFYSQFVETQSFHVRRFSSSLRLWLRCVVSQRFIHERIRPSEYDSSVIFFDESIIAKVYMFFMVLSLVT